MLHIKEVFYSLQGEGSKAGKPTLFVRFSGCNLWSGLEKDKENSPCYFCDTDFLNGKKYTVVDLANEIVQKLPKNNKTPYIVFTGGEPTLQLSNSILNSIKFELLKKEIRPSFGLETNGEKNFVYDEDVWITVSPKTKGFKLEKYNELKLLYPLKNISPNDIVKKSILYLQPIFDKDYDNNLNKTLSYCLNNPEWNLSLQLHKILKIE